MRGNAVKLLELDIVGFRRRLHLVDLDSIAFGGRPLAYRIMNIKSPTSVAIFCHKFLNTKMPQSADQLSSISLK